MNASQKAPLRRKNGFSGVEVIIVAAVLGLIGAVSFFAYQNLNKGGQLNANNSAVDARCSLNDGIEFCVQASDESVSPTDTLKLKASLKNRTDSLYETERIYSSSCNEPSVKINDEDVMDFGACTQDITSIEIEADKTKIYDMAIDTANLKQGSNIIVLSWNAGKLKSKPITITLREATAADAAKSQSCLGEQEMRPYCTNVMIVFESSGGGTEEAACRELESYVKPLGLAAVQSDCNLSDIGILTVYVPSNDADEWVRRINQIPEVKSANAS